MAAAMTPTSRGRYDNTSEMTGLVGVVTLVVTHQDEHQHCLPARIMAVVGEYRREWRGHGARHVVHCWLYDVAITTRH